MAVALAALMSYILFLKILAVEAVDIRMPTAAEPALEVNSPLMVLLLIFVVGADDELLNMPKTVPPVDDIAEMVFPEQFCVRAELPLPSVMAVMAADAVIPEMVLSFTEVLICPPRSDLITLTAPVPQVQLLKTLSLIFFLGPDTVPATLFQPAMMVAPESVILEKLLRNWFITLNGAPSDGDTQSYSVTVPPATGFEKAVTIRLSLQLSVMPGPKLIGPVLLINVTLPELLMLILVKVLLLMPVVDGATLPWRRHSINI